ncbi:MAG: hypothetical protein H7A23_12050 [Leptospiraceae bacterium]|nr:hypothetical protein [Leptospiraceae bacterium]
MKILQLFAIYLVVFIHGCCFIEGRRDKKEITAFFKTCTGNVIIGSSQVANVGTQVKSHEKITAKDNVQDALIQFKDFGKTNETGIKIQKNSSLYYISDKNMSIDSLIIHLEKGQIGLTSKKQKKGKENIKIVVVTDKYKAVFECNSNHCVSNQNGDLILAILPNRLKIYEGSGQCIIGQEEYRIDKNQDCMPKSL